MRRVATIFVRSLTLISGLLCMLAIVLWVRGYRVKDEIRLGYFNFHAVELDNVPRGNGIDIEHRVGQSAVYFVRHACVTGPNRKVFDRCRHDVSQVDGISQYRWPTTLGFGYRDQISRVRWVVSDSALVFATGIIPCVQLFINVRRRRRQLQDPWSCKICGYDLRATPEDQSRYPLNYEARTGAD